MRLIFIVTILQLATYSVAQTFTDINAVITGVEDGSAIWGDYDGDNDLDCFITGIEFNNLDYISGLYQNNSGTFTLLDNELKNIATESTVASWGDYDNDNDIDLIVNSQIFNNDGGVFTNINASIISLRLGSVSWGDYDNDNDLDLLISGTNGSNYLSIIYRNDNGNFVDISAGLPGIWDGTSKWGDFDDDGDLDILFVGKTGNSGDPNIGKVYTNTANVFSEGISFEGIGSGSADWGDYDNDGDLDIVVSGNKNTSGTILPYTKLYVNNDGTLTDSSIDLPNLVESSVGWVDFDLDGNLDLFLTGQNENGKSQTVLYKNESAALTIFETNFINVFNGSFDWGDYDRDGLLDLIISGTDNTAGFSFNVKIYKQDVTPPPTFSIDYDIIEVEEDFGNEIFVNVTPDNAVEATYSLSPESVDFCTISINTSTGQVSIQSLDDQFGEQVFTLTATDNNDNSNTSSQDFSVSVSSVNDQPQIQQLASDLSIPENTSIEIVLDNLIVTDVDNTFPDEFTLTVLTGSNYTLSGNIVTPDTDFVGDLIVPVKVNDGAIDSELFNVSISVTQVIPTFLLDHDIIEVEEDFENEIFINLIPDNSVEVTYSLSPESVDFCSVSINPSTGQVSIESLDDQFGEQVFTLTATDNDDNTNTSSQNFSISVSAVNDQPVIQQLASDLSIPENTSIEIVLDNLIVTDVDNTFPDEFTLTVLTGSNYTLSGNIVTPDIDFVGDLIVPVKVNDGTIDSELFNVSISITTVLGTDSHSNKQRFLIFPNPSSTYLKISSEMLIEPDLVKIISLDGKLIDFYQKNMRIENNTIDISTLPKGNYLLLIFADVGNPTLKFVKE